MLYHLILFIMLLLWVLSFPNPWDFTQFLSKKNRYLNYLSKLNSLESQFIFYRLVRHNNKLQKYSRSSHIIKSFSFVSIYFIPCHHLLPIKIYTSIHYLHLCTTHPLPSFCKQFDLIIKIN